MNQLDVGLLLLIFFCCVYSLDFTDDVIAEYREKVRRMFYHAYDGYLTHAYPLDELKPITCAGHDTWGSFSLTLVDALDTLLIMGNNTEFSRAVDLVLQSVKTDANVNVSVFETNIRVVGGLLSAHMLSGRVKGMKLADGWPCDGPLLRLAEQMAERLLPAFHTETGMPYGTVNLRYGVHKTETPITCTAGVGTFIVEFGALSRLTGNEVFEKAALRALESLWETRSPIGLVGNHVNVQTGQWTATDSGIGAGVDSYFEYLVKGALLFQRPALMQQFRDYATSINRYVRKEDWFMWVTMQKGVVSLPIFQSLEAFWPGLLTMVGDIEDASRIMLQYSQTIRQYGFPPEFYNIPNAEPNDKRAAFPLRPEMAESLMYLYRATEDPKFLEIGAQLVDAIEHSAKTKCGYATINNVNDHSIEDRMESFFLAETTKYLYLLFDPENFMHNDGSQANIVDTPNGECAIAAGGYIYNTEAHPIDPAIVHCCSRQKEREQESLRKWEKDVDFSQLLHNDAFGSAPKFNVEASVPDEFSEKNDGAKYVEVQYGTSDIEFEIDDSFITGEDLSNPEPIATDPLVQDDVVKETSESATEASVVTPTPTGKAEEVEKTPSTGIDRLEVVQQVRELIKKARIMDEEKRQRGEVSAMADKLVQNLKNMYKEYADVVLLAKQLDDLDAEDVRIKAAKRTFVATIPVVEAECENCCYPLEFIGESVLMRQWLSILYERLFYPAMKVDFDYGPVCRPRDEPRIEDNYINEIPAVGDLTTLDQVPDIFGSISLLSFGFDDVSHLGFDLLSSPPVGFSYKFIGLGQVSPRQNSSWYYGV